MQIVSQILIFIYLFNACYSKIALLITLASDHKISKYFEWSCRSIDSSKDILDMIVFHENNNVVTNFKCSNNVHFINVGLDGFSNLIVDKILGQTEHESSKYNLQKILKEIISRAPKYLVEIKPLLGSLFHSYLQDYSHWAYSDPDILWGNLSDWLTNEDLRNYDVLTFSKKRESSKLYLRGQLTILKNIPEIYELWKILPYFNNIAQYANRMAIAHKKLSKLKLNIDDSFHKYFFSSEGWFSNAIFQNNFKVKIVGYALDEFSDNPILLMNGKVFSCRNKNHSSCFEDFTNSNRTFSQSNLQTPKYIEAEVFTHDDRCKMAWLPIESRSCIGIPIYNKDLVMAQDSQNDFKLMKINEAIYKSGKWYYNDEMSSRHKVQDFGAFFHFKSWNEITSYRINTLWNDYLDVDSLGCMFLYMRYDKKLSFESCPSVFQKEKIGPLVLNEANDPIIDGNFAKNKINLLLNTRKVLLSLGNKKLNKNKPNQRLRKRDKQSKLSVK